jgi:hypothetical protein
MFWIPAKTGFVGGKTTRRTRTLNEGSTAAREPPDSIVEAPLCKIVVIALTKKSST